jgi:hypothetical protein
MALEGGERSASRPGRSLPRKTPDTHCKEAGWAPGPVWTGAEKLAPTGIRSPDRPARRQSLYRLRYQAHPVLYTRDKETSINSKILTFHLCPVDLCSSLMLSSVQAKILFTFFIYEH